MNSKLEERVRSFSCNSIDNATTKKRRKIFLIQSIAEKCETSARERGFGLSQDALLWSGILQRWTYENSGRKLRRVPFATCIVKWCNISKGDAKRWQI